MLMLSVPAAIMMSASPVRMRSAAIDTALRPDEQKRLIGHAGDAVRQPREQHADARDVHALLVLGHRAADDHVVDARRDRCAGTCASTLAARARAACRGASSGTRRAAPCRRRCASRRRCRRPAFVLVMALISLSSAAACRSQACARCAPASARRCSSAMNSLRSSSSSHSSSTRLPGSTSPPHSTRAIAPADLEIVRADEAAVAHVDEHHLQRRDAGLADHRHVARGQRRPVARRRPARAPAPSRRAAARSAFITTTSAGRR